MKNKIKKKKEKGGREKYKLEKISREKDTSKNNSDVCLTHLYVFTEVTPSYT